MSLHFAVSHPPQAGHTAWKPCQLPSAFVGQDVSLFLRARSPCHKFFSSPASASQGQSSPLPAQNLLGAQGLWHTHSLSLWWRIGPAQLSAAKPSSGGLFPSVPTSSSSQITFGKLTHFLQLISRVSEFTKPARCPALSKTASTNGNISSSDVL